MDSLSDNFQKHVGEIQFLKKQVSGEKLAHENTLRQLQGAYQIIDEIKDALRVEQANGARVKGQLLETAGKLQAVSQQYEQQIGEIKEMIALKDQELRRINSFLMVNDADVIRLKVINELELTHREEVEKLRTELLRRQAEMGELQANHALLCNKNEDLQRQAREQLQSHREEVEQLNSKYIGELKETYEQLEKERIEHSKWAKKHELLQTRSLRQAEFYKAEIAKLNQELHNQSKSLLSTNEAKTNKLRLEKFEEEVLKLKEELANERQAVSKAEEETARLRKEIKGFRKIEQDWAIEKDRLLEQVQALNRDLLAKEAHSRKALESLRRQLQEKSENSSTNVREGRERLEKLELDNKRASFRIQELQLQNQALKDQSPDKNTASLRRELADKTEEVAELKEEVRSLRRKEGGKRASSREEGQLKGKLQEANDKIVQLLREKIALKREIVQLRGEK